MYESNLSSGNEYCPLTASGGYARGGHIPDICRENCEELWDAASSGPASDQENYREVGLDISDCSHGAVEFSHDTLQTSERGTAQRFYAVVDACMDCETEVGESSYEFQCRRP